MLLLIFRGIFIVVILAVLFANVSSKAISGSDEEANFWAVVCSGLGMAIFVFLLDIFTPKKKLTALAGVFLVCWLGCLSVGCWRLW